MPALREKDLVRDIALRYAGRAYIACYVLYEAAWPGGRVDAKATRFVKGRLLRVRMVRSNRSGVDVAHGRIGAHQLGQKLDDDARPQRKIPSGRIHH